MPAEIRLVKKVRTLKAAMKELIELAAQYGITVEPGRDNSFDYDENDPNFKPIRITYASPAKIRTQVWGLAHELGHFLSAYKASPDVRSNLLNARSGSYWQLEAELLAWGIADCLIEQLNPSFYEEAYIQWKHLNLKTYYRN